MIKELWWRIGLKTITWRIVGFTALGLLSYLLTGSLILAGSIALVDTVIKTALYIAHEAIWARSNVGRRVSPSTDGAVVWFTGLSGSGKTTVADAVKEKLSSKLKHIYRIDGDVARRTFSKDLGFSDDDRSENCKRAAHVSSYLKENSIVLSSFISPSKEMRDYVKHICGAERTFVVHVDCPISECVDRDPKGMYAKVKDGKFMGNPFTGLHEDAPYTSPENADLVLSTHNETVSESADKVIKMLRENGCL